MNNFLNDILAHKYKEVKQQASVEPISLLQERMEGLAPTLDFEEALCNPRVPGKVSLVAEIKKASPSKGLLCPDFNPAVLAGAYSRAGASALSVLTDERFFMGDLAYLLVAKVAAGGRIPVLRKDFIVNPYQVYQARVYGADAILLIMAALEDELASKLYSKAVELGLAALVEVHNEIELERALKMGARIIGVNNRDLHTFKVDLETTARVGAALPPDFQGILISESGISSREDVVRLRSYGAKAVLIGETLVKAASGSQGLDTTLIEQKVSELFI